MHSHELILTWLHLQGPISKQGHSLRHWGLGLQHFEVDSIQPITSHNNLKQEENEKSSKHLKYIY